jgi:uncharacterized repeat protein (TIGR03803 family)
VGTPSGAKTACAVLVLCVTMAIALPAQTFKTLHSFSGTDGANPDAGLVQATDGNLYGTTEGGGAIGNYGTVFKLTPAGMLTTLHSFDSTDGANPTAELLQATDGNLYGTTYGGGPTFSGTVFKITPGGTLTVLYSFCSQSNCTDGANPKAGLIQATDGNFYGTTFEGGANGSGASGDGTIFKITPSGALTTLYSFCSQSNCTDGFDPSATMVQARDGNFYGTTLFGGANADGTIFKITPGGVLTTLHSFDSTDGSNPNGLIQATDGNLYGTTYLGGANLSGTVFKITPSGALTTLYSFCSQSNCTDGNGPAGLVQATDGKFYGTTATGGANGGGTVFNITPGSTLTTVYSFCSQSDCTDGDLPYAGLVQDTNGKLYGTAFRGGIGDGTVFRLSVGLGPFVKTQTTSGKVGASVKILGTNLTGATSVTFNGTAAAFTVESPTAIKATVPTGANTGPVQVVTPSGTLTSNVPFQVRP